MCTECISSQAIHEVLSCNQRKVVANGCVHRKGVEMDKEKRTDLQIIKTECKLVRI